MFGKKKIQNRIINQNKHLPKPNPLQSMKYLQNQDKHVTPVVIRQTRKNKNILYGAFGMNYLLGKGYRRNTKDIDIYSKQPLKNALETENTLDDNIGLDIAYVEIAPYSGTTGRGKVHRVRIRGIGNNNPVVVDYNKTPKNIKIVKKNGVRIETTGYAMGKYKGIITMGPSRRIYNTALDVNRISRYKAEKKIIRGVIKT